MSEKIPAGRERPHLVLIYGLLLCFLPVILLEVYAISRNHGVFIYPVDDVYIHMQVARNLAFHGSWGIEPGIFASASSSLLYTCLLGFLFRIFSIQVILPFVINCLAAFALIWTLRNWMRSKLPGYRKQLLVMTLMVVCTPLPIMIMSGMEHTLQCLFSFLLLTGACTYIGSDNSLSLRKEWPWKLAVYGALLTATRYEGLFLVGLICLSFAYYRQWAAAFFIGVVSLLPVIAFGIYSVAHGGYFLPNSVLVKSEEVPLFGAGIAHFLQTILADKLTFSLPGITAVATQRLLLLLPLTALLVYRNANRMFRLMLVLLTFCTLIHLALASTGKFYRYEAYLMACSFVIMPAALLRYGNDVWKDRSNEWRWMAVLFGFFLLIPVGLRLSAAYSKAGRACINIYQQQYQMACFLRDNDPKATVAANDIGAISFFTGCRVIDLWGLGNNDIAKSRIKGYWTPDLLDSISRQQHAGMAIIYDSWFKNAFTTRWKKLATWQIPQNVVCGDDIVSFYAIDSTQAPRLAQQLHTYQKKLPAAINVQYYPLP